MNKSNTNLVKLSNDGQAIVICFGNQYFCDIDLSKITSAHDIIDWYFHLSEKIDVTPEILAEFMSAIQIVCSLYFNTDPRNLFVGGDRIEWPGE